MTILQGALPRPRAGAGAARLLAAAGLAAALALALWAVFTKSIWYDDAISLLQVAGFDENWPTRPVPAAEARAAFEAASGPWELVAFLRDHSVHPPGYHLTLLAWRGVAGYGLEAARLLSVLLVAGAVFATYAYARSAGMARPCVAAVFMSLSAAVILFASNARPYALGLPLLCLAMLAAERSASAVGRGGTSWPWAALLGASVGLGFLTHYFTVFAGGFLLLWHMARVWRWDRRLAVGPCLLAGSLMSLAAPILMVQFTARPDQWSGFQGLAPELVALAKAQIEVLVGIPEQPRPRAALYATTLSALAIAFLAALVPALAGRDKAATLRLTLALGGVAANGLGIFLLFLLTDKSVVLATADRYFGFAAPFLALLLADGAAALSRVRPLGGAVFACVVAGCLLAGGLLQKDLAEWRALGREIAASPARPALVVAGKGFGKGGPGTVAYEIPDDVHFAVITPGEDPAALAMAAQSYAEVWYVPVGEASATAESAWVAAMRASGHWRDERRGQVLVFRPAPGGA